MKPIQLRPLSVAVGALGACLALGLAGMVSPQHLQRLPLKASASLLVEGIPLPKDMRQVMEGESLLVPAGRVFVVTGLGRSSSLGSEVAVAFDGVPVWFGSLATNAQTTHNVPSGLVAQPGVAVSSVGASSVVLGHFADL